MQIVIVYRKNAGGVDFQINVQIVLVTNAVAGIQSILKNKSHYTAKITLSGG